MFGRERNRQNLAREPFEGARKAAVSLVANVPQTRMSGRGDLSSKSAALGERSAARLVVAADKAVFSYRLDVDRQTAVNT